MMTFVRIGIAAGLLALFASCGSFDSVLRNVELPPTADGNPNIIPPEPTPPPPPPGRQAYSDTFNQSAFHSLVDMLFVIDNSGSMRDEQTNLATNFRRLADALKISNYDYRVGIITTDSSVFRGTPRFLTPTSSPDPAADFATRVALLGISGSGNEHGLEMARLALMSEMDFVRPNARLHVVIVSDEEDTSDYSCDPDQCSSAKLVSNRSIEDYVASFRAIETIAFKLHPIVALPSDINHPSPICLIQYGSQNIGSRYIQLAAAFGNTNPFSICSPSYSSIFDQLVPEIFKNDTFRLSYEPDPTTISVRVSGILVTRYEYRASSRSIVFMPDAIPPAGAEVRIDYWNNPSL